MDNPSSTAWTSGEAYENYVGRWSKHIAPLFLQWLGIGEGKRWLDVGCGTGMLTRTILENTNPAHVEGIDRSEAFTSFAQNHVQDTRAQFEVGDAQALPVETEAYDVTVSGLMLNFVPQPDRALAEMVRATQPGGTVALYVWDYAVKMQFMRHFWNAAVALNPLIREMDEGRRSPICNPTPLTELFQMAGLKDVEVRAIDIDTHFRDFDDYWSPFLGGQGPAPGYVMSLSEEHRTALRDRIYNGLPFAIDGSIPLVARTWAIRGIC